MILNGHLWTITQVMMLYSGIIMHDTFESGENVRTLRATLQVCEKTQLFRHSINHDVCSVLTPLPQTRVHRYNALPTMHCFRWHILYKRSCRAIVMKHALLTELIPILHFRHVSSLSPHMTNLSYWEQCIVRSAPYLLLRRSITTLFL